MKANVNIPSKSNKQKKTYFLLVSCHPQAKKTRIRFRIRKSVVRIRICQGSTTLGSAILAFDKAEQTVCQPMADGGPEQRHQGLHMQDGEDDSLLVGAAARVVQAVQQLAHRLTLHGANGVMEP
jgi:hypothetical protein